MSSVTTIKVIVDIVKPSFIKMPLNLFVTTANNKTYTIPILDRELQTLTVLGLKKKIEDKTGVPPEEQRLVVGDEQLIHDGKLIKDYQAIKPQCTIHLIIRLPGGQDCVGCYGRSTFVSPCRCRTPYCKECILRNCQSMAGNRKSTMTCSSCHEKWDLVTIQQLSGISDTEFNKIAKQISQNFVNVQPGIRECPGCNNYCERQDKTKFRVYCRLCSRAGKPAEYCFQCSLPWRNSSSNTYCGNSNCKSSSPLSLLPLADYKTIGSISNCPSLRLCPKCGIPIEHTRDCQRMECAICAKVFCFICLADWSSDNSHYFTKTCKPAPVQTSVPG